MKGLLHYDGFLAKIMTKTMYVVGLNLLFLLCSIPIFTIGAASTAMWTVLLRYLQDDEPNIIKSFFGAFRENFQKSTLIWLVMLAVLSTLGMNYYLLYHSQIPSADLIRAVLNLVLVMLAALWVYLFPSMAYFENSLKGYLIYSVGIAVAKLPYTIALLAIQILPLLIVLYLAQYFPMAVLLLICCGAALPAYWSGKLLLHLFGAKRQNGENAL